MPYDPGAIVDRMFASLAAGDVPAAAACLAPDARVWHGFDQIAQDRDAIVEGWNGLVANFAMRAFVDVRRQSTDRGIVQQHLMIVEAGGRRMAWPICILVEIRDGLIVRLDEYIDRAGSFTPADGDLGPTPGLA